MLLTNSKGSRMGANCEESEGVEKEVKRLIVIVKRGRREGEIDCFDRESISAHDIDFFGVVGDVVDAEKAADSIEVDEGGGEELDAWDDDTGDTDDIDTEDANEGETDEVNEMINAWEVDFSNFVCFSRTWSWSLMLLRYFSKQRLQTNASVFSFVIRAFSICIASSSNLFKKRLQKLCNEANSKAS